MKVVWLCHFSNKEMKEYFGVPELNEFSPWINNLIELFINLPGIDLHIVAPNVFNNTDSVFIKRGISYHFFKRLPIPFNNKYLKKIHSFLHVEYLTDFFWVKYKISHFVNRIDPDIIHLHGAENPYYSAGILPLLNKYRTFITIQGFIRNTTENSINIRKAIRVEEDIIKGGNNIGVRTLEMNETVLSLNPLATLHFHNYPLAIPTVMKTKTGRNESIDCLFFANVCKDKGIEDLLSAISIVKGKVGDVSLVVIGNTDKKYLTKLKFLCSELRITDNVEFLGFLPTQEDIYEVAIKAKMCVLPTYHDVIPGTIIESMFIKLPVVAYAVGGIPELNSDGDSVIIVEKSNINQLAEKILELLFNQELRTQLSEKAYELAHRRFNNDRVVLDIQKAYNAILHK